MDTPGTGNRPIRCASCDASFLSRRSALRMAWRQRSLPRDVREPVIAWLCDKCEARFSSEDAALDLLDGVLERAAS